MKLISKYSFALLATSGAILLSTPGLRASETDDRIEAAAKNTYVFKTYLKEDSIKTESKDGKVILTGTVSEKSHKSLAKYTVEGLPGVASVDDRLEVKSEDKDEHSDSWLAMKIKSTLLFHRSVRGTGTHIIVQNGVVTLDGDASSFAQRDLTTEYTKDIEGVKEVNNRMTVNDPKNTAEVVAEKIDDASVTAQVKWTLLAHRSTSLVATEVHTENGVVTLMGTASSAAQRDLVTKVVTDVKGVSNVVNEMTLK